MECFAAYQLSRYLCSVTPQAAVWPVTPQAAVWPVTSSIAGVARSRLVFTSSIAGVARNKQQ